MQVPPVSATYLVLERDSRMLNVPETIEALTDTMYAIAKKVANPALTSVKNLEPFLSCRCPENSSLKCRPTTLLATAVLVFSTCS